MRSPTGTGGVLRPASGLGRFEDRRQAGRLLGRALAEAGVLEPGAALVVVGLARGGVVVADEVARALEAPLDALAVRKVGHPWQPEYGIGAVAPGGIRYVRSRDGLTDEELEEAVRRAAAAADALDARLHERCAPLRVADTTCVLVDDGLATGGTMVAAVRWARARGAARVLVAVPVAAAETVRTLERDPSVDGVVCLVASREFGAVGFWYEDFRQVSDDDVRGILDAAFDRQLTRRSALIPCDDARLPADLAAPPQPLGWVVFAHGSGSSRLSPRNLSVAATLNRARIATLLFDLLTREEELDRRNVFDVGLLAARLVAATRWLRSQPEAARCPIGYFGASTGAAAALIAAAELGGEIAAVVSRGGRPDLAAEWLDRVRAPTLLVVGSADPVVLELNRQAARALTCRTELAVIPGATHLFAEPGALEQVASLAAAWFTSAFEHGAEAG
ncbi:MAG TPA: phosphoribosyltransferase family protein [Gaiellaceae bacterium]|nr:phosphoribosyltransferase family protein [Gaiellaceae bacterium]